MGFRPALASRPVLRRSMMATFITPSKFNGSSVKFRTGTNGPFPTVYQNSSVNISGVDDVIVRNSNPSWRVQVARKSEAGTPYYAKRSEILSLKPLSGTSSQKSPPGPSQVIEINDFFGLDVGSGFLYAVGSDSDSSLDNQAIERLKRRLREQSHESRSMAPVAEFKDLGRTIETLANFTSDAFSAIRDLKRGRTKRARRLLYDSWLTWNFGIAPLVRDVHDAAEALREYLVRKDLTVRLRGHAEREWFGSYIPTFAVLGGLAPIGAQTYQYGNFRAKLSYSYVGSYSLTLRSSNDYTVSSALGFDLRNLPSTLWELTAFSWVVDYFANVGEFLDDTFYSPPGNLIYLSKVRKFEVVAHGILSAKNYPVAAPSSTSCKVYSNAESTVRYSVYERTVLASLPTVGLRLKMSNQVARNAVSKLLNLVSVMRL